MSPKRTLNKEDLISIGKSVILAAIGAAAAYLLQTVLPNIDLGKQAWVIPVATVLLNIIKKLAAGN